MTEHQNKLSFGAGLSNEEVTDDAEVHGKCSDTKVDLLSLISDEFSSWKPHQGSNVHSRDGGRKRLFGDNAHKASNDACHLER